MHPVQKRVPLSIENPEYLNQLKEQIEFNIFRNMAVQFDRIIQAKVETCVAKHIKPGLVNKDIQTFVDDHKDWLKGTLDQWADQF